MLLSVARSAVALALVAPLVAGHAIAPRQASSGTATAAPVPALTTAPSAVADACARASAAAASWNALRPRPTDTRIIPSLALGCLQSVPLDKVNDVALIDHLTPYVEFQSTLGWLKKPPRGYLIPGVDVLGALEEIKASVSADRYANQYHFIADLVNVFNAASDGHFAYFPALATVFSLNRGFTITSVSANGVDLPKIYEATDLARSRQQQNYVPSEIVSIDGVPVQQFLTEAAQLGSRQQDPDSKYNDLFQTVAKRAGKLGVDAFSQGSIVSLPDTHAVVFGNGSARTYANHAVVNVPLTGITTGARLHAAVELVTPTAGGANTGPRDLTSIKRELDKRQFNTPPSQTPVPEAGYPARSLVSMHRKGYMAGYTLDVPGFTDVCVLSLWAFISPADAVNPEAAANDVPNINVKETRRVAQQTFAACKRAGRTRLVVDMTANGGGSLFAGHELYRSLFPRGRNAHVTRFRATAVVNWLGGFLFKGLDWLRLFGNSVRPDGSPISTWQTAFGPQTFVEDGLTNAVMFDFSNGTTASDSPLEFFFVTGYGPQAAQNPPEQPFRAEDIVILTDGACASTCTLFTGLMVREQGVRTIAVGGRPLEKPMQAIGGTKGTEVLNMGVIKQVMAALASLGARAPAGVNLPSGRPAPLEPAALDASAFNWRNSYPEDKTNGPPLQFVYEAANCRRFWRAEHDVDITSLWADAAQVAWKGGKCVRGSSTGPDQTIGGSTLPFSNDVVSSAVYNGPGRVNGGLAVTGSGPDGSGGAGGGGGSGSGGGDDSAASSSRTRSLLGVVVAGIVAVAMLV